VKTFRTRLVMLLPALLVAAAAGIASAQEASNPTVDGQKKQLVIDEIARHMTRAYVFPETAKKVEERLRARLARGEYDAEKTEREFARAVARDILEVTKDRHTGFAFAPEQAADLRRLDSRSDDEVRQARERQAASARWNNFAFRKVERMAGNVGYLDFRNFLPAEVAGDTATAALNFLAHCDAIIIDLRQNGGGDPTMIQLITSYFFRDPVHLNDIHTRETDSTENFWTLPYVPGRRMPDVDLYLLTSARTFSAAEEFVYNLKNLKRATLVGETTGGGAHPTNEVIVQQDFVLRVPFARSINPISKTNWEGTGVAPDVAVPAAAAFDKAYEMALDRLRTKASAPAARAQIDWVLAGIRARTAPPALDEPTLRSYAGSYGDRKVTFENGALFYERTGPKYRLVPLTRTLFALDGMDTFRLEFVVTDGKAVEVTGIYDNGQRDQSKRTGS
jgi:retinol-binding protein 3